MEENVRRLGGLQLDNDKRWENFEPVSEIDMKWTGYRLTVCELLRQIYASTNDSNIKMKCRMAVTMARIMATKLKEHEGASWGRKYYPWNPLRRHDRMKAKYDKREEIVLEEEIEEIPVIVEPEKEVEEIKHEWWRRY